MTGIPRCYTPSVSQFARKDLYKGWTRRSVSSHTPDAPAESKPKTDAGFLIFRVWMVLVWSVSLLGMIGLFRYSFM